MRTRLAIALVVAACGGEEPTLPPVAHARAAIDGVEIVSERVLKRARLILARDDAGDGKLFIEPEGRPAAEIPCEPLRGAWGLWVDDVDGDGNAEAIVALRKRAKFDDRVANRLHVYGFEDGRCVPAWRGTRLAGRFDALTVEKDRPGTLLARERVGVNRMRVARYRWNDFGYRVEAILWEGAGSPPAELDELLQERLL